MCIRDRIETDAAKLGLDVDILLEVNVAREESKYGFLMEEVEDAIMQIKDFSHVHIKGLMTIAPFVDNPEENRGIFKKLFEFAVDIGSKNIDNVTMSVLDVYKRQAYDLYLIFNEALKYPVFRQIVGTTSYTANYHDKDSQAVTKTWKGGNWFMTRERETPEGLTVFGGKTGTTNAAGYCLIMATRDQDDKEYISVVLKSDSRPGLYDNMTNIISKIVK